jgi:hypothetical protein
VVVARGREHERGGLVNVFLHETSENIYKKTSNEVLKY